MAEERAGPRSATGRSRSGAIEADGPAGDGKVTLGCLTPGLTYNFVIDAIGDAGGPLGVELVQP